LVAVLRARFGAFARRFRCSDSTTSLQTHFRRRIFEVGSEDFRKSCLTSTLEADRVDRTVRREGGRERDTREGERDRERKKILSYFVAVVAPTCAVVFPMSYIAYWNIGASRLALEEKEEALLAHHAGLLLVVVVPPLLVCGSLLTPLLAR
jgi:hypothetical protein